MNTKSQIRAKFKIAYVATYAAEDVRNWSGLGYYMLKAIESFAEVVLIDKLKSPNIPIKQRAKIYIYKFIFRKVYLYNRETFCSQSYADEIEKRLPNDIDFIFCPGTVPVALLKTNTPIIFWTDATFDNMVNFYPDFKNLCKETQKAGNFLEKNAIEKASLGIYSSTWAYKSAIEKYSTNPQKLMVLPFGANLKEETTKINIDNIIANRSSMETCKLLFVGVDWERKGGDTALNVVKKLNEKGIKTELHVVGIKNLKVSPKSYIINHGIINKDKKNDVDKLRTLFINSHFLILPSIAECFGIVFCEASSYGLPSLASNIGGIPSAIQNEVNGHLFNIGAVDDYANYIQEYFSDKSKYKSLSISSYNEFKQRLNWEVNSKFVYEKLISLKAKNVNK